jgi:DNA polymerase-3 subunit beta
MDALSALHTQEVRVTLTDPNSSCLIRHPDNDNCRYVVMPMRL